MPMNSHHCRRAGISRSIFAHFFDGQRARRLRRRLQYSTAWGVNKIVCGFSRFLAVCDLLTAAAAGCRLKAPAGLLFLRGTMIFDDRYRAVGERLIRELQEFSEIAASDVRIAWLSSQEEKRKSRRTVFGECHKVPDLYRWCCDYDFFIVIYEPNVTDFTEEQIETLIRHELHHVGIEYANTGLKYYIVPHDVEEFWEIIHEHGLKWSDRYAEREQPEQQGEPEKGKTV